MTEYIFKKSKNFGNTVSIVQKIDDTEIKLGEIQYSLLNAIRHVAANFLPGTIVDLSEFEEQLFYVDPKDNKYGWFTHLKHIKTWIPDLNCLPRN